MGVNAVMLSVPQFATDLRPTADAAASVRETRPAPAIALGPVQTVFPPVPTQAAAVSRVIIGASVTEVGPPPAVGRTGAEPTERRLVPFGVFMLPEPLDEAKQRPEPSPAANQDRPKPPAASEGPVPGAPRSTATDGTAPTPERTSAAPAVEAAPAKEMPPGGADGTAAEKDDTSVKQDDDDNLQK